MALKLHLRHPMVQASLGLYLLLAASPLRGWLEATMTGHMLVQIPLLAAVGWGVSHALSPMTRTRLLASCGGPFPPVLVSTFASSYWMLPRALDAALADPLVEAAKLVGVPLAVGFPLALAWPRLGAIARGFVLTNAFSMLAVLGWLYLAAPVRVCNAYAEQDQATAGRWMVTMAVVLFLGWLARWFVAAPARSSQGAEAGQAERAAARTRSASWRTRPTNAMVHAASATYRKAGGMKSRKSRWMARAIS
jgi:hypothetical protein